LVKNRKPAAAEDCRTPRRGVARKAGRGIYAASWWIADQASEFSRLPALRIADLHAFAPEAA
jgi:hypothetical protein